MEIKYLTKLKDNPVIGIREIKGHSAAEIEDVEEKFNIKFPLAYKEFLFLAGESRGALTLMDTADLETISSDWHQEMMKEEMESTSTIIDRPFWLFAESNGCEVFYFFYLDESTEDPIVYLVNYGIEDDTTTIKPLGVTFSEFINSKIDMAYRYEKEGW